MIVYAVRETSYIIQYYISQAACGIVPFPCSLARWEQENTVLLRKLNENRLSIQVEKTLPTYDNVSLSLHVYVSREISFDALFFQSESESRDEKKLCTSSVILSGQHAPSRKGEVCRFKFAECKCEMSARMSLRVDSRVQPAQLWGTNPSKRLGRTYNYRECLRGSVKTARPVALAS